MCVGSSGAGLVHYCLRLSYGHAVTRTGPGRGIELPRASSRMALSEHGDPRLTAVFQTAGVAVENRKKSASWLGWEEGLGGVAYLSHISVCRHTFVTCCCTSGTYLYASSGTHWCTSATFVALVVAFCYSPVDTRSRLLQICVWLWGWKLGSSPYRPKARGGGGGHL